MARTRPLRAPLLYSQGMLPRIRATSRRRLVRHGVELLADLFDPQSGDRLDRVETGGGFFLAMVKEVPSGPILVLARRYAVAYNHAQVEETLELWRIPAVFVASYTPGKL